MIKSIIIMCGCVLFLVRSAIAAEVALFTNTQYVDYNRGDFNAEASNIEAALESKNHLVIHFTETSFGNDLSPFFDGKEVLLIPELEIGDLSTAYSTKEYSEIQRFINAGGLLIVFGDLFGRSLSLLNTTFGFSLSTAPSVTQLGLSESSATDTPFQGGPAILPENDATHAVMLESLPPGVRAIYQAGNSVGVFAVPIGSGWLIYLGWDWYDASPVGSADGGWTDVLYRAMDFAPRLEFDRCGQSSGTCFGQTIFESFDIDQTITLSNGRQYTDVEVTLSIDHGWPGDLVVTLGMPDGTSVKLMDRPGHPDSSVGQNKDLQSEFPISFNNSAVVPADDVGDDCGSISFINDTCTRVLIPEEPLLVSPPKPIAGDWTLTVRDDASGFVGVLRNWSLSFPGIPRNIPKSGITVTPTAGMFTTENGEGATFTVVLNSKPSADLTINLSSDDLAEGEVSSPSLTFTPVDWSVPKIVTVSGIDDSVIDGKQDYNIVIAPAMSEDSNYEGLDPKDVTVVNLDNEPDIYEDDNTSASARVIQANFSGFRQQHTIHSGEDEDWVQFYRDYYGSFYYFELTHQGGPGNLVLELYDTDGTTLLCSAVVTETDKFGGFDESCGTRFDQVAIYYLRVSLESPASGIGPSYILNVAKEGAFESSIRGSVKDGNGNALEAVVLRAIPQGGFSFSSAYTMSGINGDYVIDLFPQNNPFILSVDKSGFIAKEIPFTAPQFSGLTMDIVMIPETPPGERDDDGDGLTNDAEIDLGTDPNDPDTDDDLMPDGYEFDNGLNPLITDANGDLDGDGLTNLAEFLAGTDPSNDTDPPISEDARPQLDGTVKTTDGTDICAIVLASGQFMFSCKTAGVFSLTDLPREKDGTIKRQIYADGFFPKIDILTGSSSEAVVMAPSGTCPNYNTSYNPGFVPGSAGKSINIAGKVLMPDGQTPICALVLANGQHTFSCDGTGSYALKIPLDSNGRFKLQVYADPFAPTVQTFDEFKTTNNVRMAPSLECSNFK